MSMTVIELIKKLSEYPPDLEVVVSSDAAGNDHRPLSERMDTCYAVEGERTRSGATFDIVDEGDWESFAYDHPDLYEDEDDLPPFPGDNALVIGP